jgi:hypothetical protein
MTAEYKVHGPVAVITLANPPVNGLGLSTRQGIVDGLNRPMPMLRSSPSSSPARVVRFLVAPTSRSSAPTNPCKSPTCTP